MRIDFFQVFFSFNKRSDLTLSSRSLSFSLPIRGKSFSTYTMNIYRRVYIEDSLSLKRIRKRNIFLLIDREIFGTKMAKLIEKLLHLAPLFKMYVSNISKFS